MGLSLKEIGARIGLHVGYPESTEQAPLFPIGTTYGEFIIAGVKALPRHDGHERWRVGLFNTTIGELPGWQEGMEPGFLTHEGIGRPSRTIDTITPVHNERSMFTPIVEWYAK